MHVGGEVHIVSIGTAMPSSEAWAYPCPARGSAKNGRRDLRLRLGMRGRITFGAGVRGLGRRTIEWEVQLLESPLEIGVHHGPCWVAKELTGTENDLSASRFIGRALAKHDKGRHVGPSTPALMWRAVEAAFNAPRQDALGCCGLTHEKVQATLEVANRAADQLLAPTAGQGRAVRKRAQPGPAVVSVFRSQEDIRAEMMAQDQEMTEAECAEFARACLDPEFHFLI